VSSTSVIRHCFHAVVGEKQISAIIPFSPRSASIDNNPTQGPPNTKTVDTCTQDSNADGCKTSPSSDTDIIIATDTNSSTNR
jgi:hypothetical protein